MRHTFTVEQKNTLLRYFESGMIGQSMAYHDKILHCAHESGLDFEVVKNWVGNQRRKRRMEEMQSACGQLPPDHKIDYLSPMPSFSKDMSNKMARTSEHDSRQSQVLFFPRSSGAPANLHERSVNLHERSVNSVPTSSMPASSPMQSPRPVSHQHISVDSHQQSSCSQYPSSLSCDTPPRDTLPHQMNTLGDDTPSPQTSLSPLPTQVPMHRQFAMSKSHQTTSSYQSAITSHSPVNAGTRYIFEGPQSSNRNSLPASRLNHVEHATSREPQPQLSPQSEIAYTQTSIMPISSGNHSIHGRRQNPLESMMSNYIDDTNGYIDSHDVEWRDYQVQKIMETVQAYVDQLHKLGCEAFLAAVSKETYATYLCGTNIGNDYFTRVNKDVVMSEYVEKIIDPDFDDEIKNDELPVERKREEKVNGEKKKEVEDKEGTTSQAEKEDMVKKDPLESSEGVIKAGEEVYIVNKQHFVIGRGRLLPAPHEKIQLKVHEPTNSDDTVLQDNGFIEKQKVQPEKEVEMDDSQKSL